MTTICVRRTRWDRVCLGGSSGRETQSRTQRKHLFSMMQSTGTISPNTESSTSKLNWKQPDNIKQLLLFLANAITMEPVRDLSDLWKRRRDYCGISLISRAREVYERLIVTEKRLTDLFESKRRRIVKKYGSETRRRTNILDEIPLCGLKLSIGMRV